MRKPNSLQDANFCSRLFWWLNPLFKIGYKQKSEEDDMYSLFPEDPSQHVGEKLQEYWDQEVKKAEKDAQEPSLMKAIIKCYWKSYVVWGIFIFLEEGTRVIQPIFFRKMISYVQNKDPTNSAALHEAYAYAAGLSACVLVWAVLHHLCFYHMQRVGMRLRVAVCRMIYRKVTIFFHYLWVGPLQAIAVTALLWMETGISCLAGMSVLIFFCFCKAASGCCFHHSGEIAHRGL